MGKYTSRRSSRAGRYGGVYAGLSAVARGAKSYYSSKSRGRKRARVVTKSKRKASRSYTQTRVKRRPKMSNRPSGNYGAATVVKCYKPVSKYYAKGLNGVSKREFINIFTGVYSSTIGAQFASLWSTCLTLGTLSELETDAASDPGWNGAGFRTQKLHVLHYVNNNTWTNNGIMPIELILFTVRVKKSCTTDPISTWNFGQTDEGDFTTNSIANVYKETPHRNKEFNKHFWIVSWKNIVMAPGDVHKHRIDVRHPRAISVSDFTDNQSGTAGVVTTSTNGYLQGYSLAHCVIVRGFPAAVNTGTMSAPVASTSAATIAPATVLNTFEERYTYKFMTPQTDSFTRGTLSITQSGAVVTESDEFIQQVRQD